MIPAVNFATDAVIALVLAAVPLFILDLRRRAAAGQDVSARQIAAAFLTLAWLATVYSALVEPRMLVSRPYRTAIGSSGEVLRVAVVSDMHLGIQKGREWTAKVVEKVNSAQPDLVVLVGDFVSVPAGLEALAPLADLQARYGAYAVLGNWDYRIGAVDVRKQVESFGVEVLTNESVTVGDDLGRPIYLIGLDDGRFGRPDWPAALAGVPAGATTVLLGHEPDFAPVAEVNGIDLLISGHTHGGQVRLPGIGSLAPMPIRISQDFDQGLFDYGQTKLFITSGVGESGARTRLFDPPEVSLLEIDY